jgi:hypothetical protein
MTYISGQLTQTQFSALYKLLDSSMESRRIPISGGYMLLAVDHIGKDFLRFLQGSEAEVKNR